MTLSHWHFNLSAFFSAQAVTYFKIPRTQCKINAWSRVFLILYKPTGAAWSYSIFWHGVYEHVLSYSNCCIIDELCQASVPSATETNMLSAQMETLCSIIKTHTTHCHLSCMYCFWCSPRKSEQVDTLCYQVSFLKLNCKDHRGTGNLTPISIGNHPF